MGEMIAVKMDSPPKVGKIRKKRIMIPNLSRKNSTLRAFFSGSKPTRILPPSRGLTGTKLKIAKETFKTTSGLISSAIMKAGEKGKEIVLDQVSLYADADKLKIGKPFLKEIVIKAEVLNQNLGEKIVVSKFKAKTGYRRKLGFRPRKTTLLIKKIEIK